MENVILQKKRSLKADTIAACHRKSNTLQLFPAIFAFLVLLQFKTSATTVNNLAGYYSNGQVFLTWLKVENQSAYYKVYRSASPITQPGQLSNIEYLGYTNSTSALDFDLTKHDNMERYFVVGPDFQPLDSHEGLFVATTLANGTYYYAVTTVLNGTEDVTIASGENVLESPVAETVAAPQPVFQSMRNIASKPIEIYSTFISSRYAANQPLMNKAGFIANDFALYRNGAASGKHPLRIRFHGGGGDFLLNIITVTGDEMNINPEHFFPSGKHAFWTGANENYNILDADSNISPPISGVNYDFSRQQVSRLIDWAIANLPVDTNRIYLEGSSMGSIGAYFYAITNPDRIAAVKLSGSVFDLSFQDDAYAGCMLNEGNEHRVEGDSQFGEVGSGLYANSGLLFYQQVNGNWMTNTYKEKDYPFIYSINGKNDTVVGWTEKTIYYQALNTSHAGGYYFWDRRKHGGGALVTWSDENFNLLRYKNNQSFPAFANCSCNEDYGDGSAASGDNYGTVNGFLDWKDNMTDSASKWKVKLFLRDLDKLSGTEPAPAFCVADVTPRRLQNFKMEPGDEINWMVEHAGSTTQSGMATFTDGILIVPGVMVYKDTVSVTLSHASKDTIVRNISGVFITPNIFEGNTTIHYVIPKQGRCVVSVYDFMGRFIKTLLDEESTEGQHQLVWNGSDAREKQAAPGIYFISVKSGSMAQTNKCVHTR